MSRVKIARAESTSIRATIPQRIVEGLKLEANDIIEWELYSDKGKTLARIRKS
ncbi:MAG: hypothetical protein WAK17_20435 [Candidatus Nitrosopolaris sp.]